MNKDEKLENLLNAAVDYVCAIGTIRESDRERRLEEAKEELKRAAVEFALGEQQTKP